jgi:nitrite reductase/ring-hydroxylating ferredoxin subunit
MAEWIEVAAMGDLLRKKKLLVQAAGQDIVLFSHEERVYALADLCVHKQKRLSKGLIFKGKAICPGHQWAFDLDTGWTDEWQVCQPTYAVKVEGTAILVDPTPRIFSPKPICA